LYVACYAGYASAQSAAVAQAISDAFTCGCGAAPATAQALSQAIAKAGGCCGVGDALAGGCGAVCVWMGWLHLWFSTLMAPLDAVSSSNL